jgi:hypothetical protein
MLKNDQANSGELLLELGDFNGQEEKREKKGEALHSSVRD